MEDYRIDEHKLMYHPQRVSEWLDTGDCYPIYMEVSPSGRCNHRCIFCALEYTGYHSPFLEASLLETRLAEMSSLGLKAIMLAGEGEPLLHPDIVNIIQAARSSGLDISVTTNGVFLHRIFEVLDKLSWVRLSLDASTSETYSHVHGCAPTDFSKVVANLEQLVYLKKQGGIECTLGVQLLLLEDNYREVVELAEMLKEVGVDYFSVKPYSQHPLSSHKVLAVTSRALLDSLDVQLEKTSTPTFQAFLRARAFGRVGAVRPYTECLGSPFFCHLTSLGEIYLCSTFVGRPELSFGNIYKNTFKEIWAGRKRQEVIRGIDISKCRENCRLDPINSYLWELKHPPAHVNFI